MSYTHTLIEVAADCVAKKSEVPVAKKEPPPAHLIQYQLLTEHPYQLDHEDLIFEVYVRQKEIPRHLLDTEGARIRKELFSKGHPCLRASALTKRYGFGAHYNAEGKIAIYPVESDEYRALLADQTVRKLPAMRNKRESRPEGSSIRKVTF